ncbi:hypothetical protein [Blastopirellula marina]|uniref:Uncharacterized protein n=1 Tax=Blastopirellula marina TaxID=124 RepID=A0A2S8FTU9_9BACT|nr:hypothetical protein [Blastopirellula marina]PQO35601.1 hypothetical protein C5Y98_13235 [Blastopirellula marina]PTL44241.1 hypothetical protein C5Y97_13245 [Blastopirellula marina]
MGLDYYFYLQRVSDDVWTTPAEFDDPTNREMRGQFMWFDDKDVTAHRLFVRDDSLFPLHRNLPPEFVITELYRASNRSPDMSDADCLDYVNRCFDDHYFGWIGFEELMIDLWSETELLIRKNVPARFASAFGDGSLRFPRETLLTLGMPEDDADRLANTWYYANDSGRSLAGYSVVDEPFIRRFGDGPHDQAAVTWKVTIAEFIGEWRMERFLKARKSAADDQLRIICTFS